MAKVSFYNEEDGIIFDKQLNTPYLPRIGEKICFSNILQKGVNDNNKCGHPFRAAQNYLIESIHHILDVETLKSDIMFKVKKI